MKRLFWQNAQYTLSSLKIGSFAQVRNSIFWHSIVPVMISVVVIALVASGCQKTPSTPTIPQAPYQPSLPPTPSTPTQPTLSLTVTTTGVDTNRPTIIEFARAFTTINKDWESYRRSYEDWRQKNTCAEPSMTESLSGFIASFQKIRIATIELPQSPLVRGVAERLIEAAEKEEASLNELRGNWKPGDEATFRKYETDRLAADRLRRQAAQGRSDLVAAIQTENIDAVEKYRQAFQAIQVDWDALHHGYDSWRQSLSSDEKDKDKSTEKERVATETLQKLATTGQAILNRVYTLPRPALIQKPADLLVEAAEKEEASLRKLKSTWKLGDKDSLTVYEREQLTINRLRRDSSLGVEGVAAAGLKENKALLQQFSPLYEQVDKSWNNFRSQYDTWRNKGGDCDRNLVRQQLSERLASFHALAQRSYALPQSAVVRPLAELMTQAAEREEIALRQLRDNWKPYDSSYYQTYEKEWGTIDRLRRQAAAGLTDLMQKNNISPTEVAP